MSDDLTLELADAFPAVVVERLFGGGWRVLFPNPRWAHDYLSISVEPVEGGWVLTDSGEVEAVAGQRSEELARLLSCAGADVETNQGALTTSVRDDEPLTARLLAFAHYLISAPVVWDARECLLADGLAASAPESPTKQLARSTRDRLVARIGGQSRAVIHLDRLVGARGEKVRAPLVLSALSPLAEPRLVAAFVDMEASAPVITSAKRLATWTFEVLHELRIPKYLVVRGPEREVEHFASFYDHHEVTAVPFSDGQQLENDARDAVRRMGLATAN